MSPLHLCDIRNGLGSVFSIPCRNDLCCHENHSSSGKRNNNGALDSNTKVAIVCTAFKNSQYNFCIYI